MSITAGKTRLIIPTIAVVGSAVGSLGYFAGSAGLFYDCYQSKKKKNDSTLNKKEEGVRTITPNSNQAKWGLNLTKVGMLATSIAGIAGGISTGMTVMALGESIFLLGTPKTESPMGLGLQAIGLASVFSGVALDSNPRMKLDFNKFRAEKTFIGKSKLILANMRDNMAEVGKSAYSLTKNILKLFTPKAKEAIKFFKNDVFSLKAKKNYIMHSASAILALGGLGVVLFTLLNKPKPQKKALKVQEAGFLFDNFGISKLGLDNISKSPAMGANFFVGGVFNAISQFMGLDNKLGRATQWGGIGFVFMGWSIQRAKELKALLHK